MTMMATCAPFKRSNIRWRVHLAALWVVGFSIIALLPIPENAVNAFPEKAFLPPLQNSDNFLGTDQLGRDVFWYLLASTKTAWWLTFPPLAGATVIGVFFGTVAARYARKPKIVSGFSFLLLLFSCVWFGSLIYLYVEWVRPSASVFNSFWLMCGVSTFVLASIWYVFKKLSFSKSKDLPAFEIPLDDFLLRIMDVWTTFPKLLLLLLLSILAPPSVLSLGFWIMATYWVLPARLSRTSSLRMRNEPYFESALALGIPNLRLLHRYEWPSMKGPLITNFCFNASGLLGIGSTLAFLGIGLPADVPSWGKMLALSRYTLEHWWLLIFPVGLLLTSVLSLQSIGNYLSRENNQD